MTDADLTKVRRYVELAVELTAETPLDGVPFIRMLLHAGDAAEAVIRELHTDGSDPATKVRFAAEVLRLYVDDAIRAMATSMSTTDPNAKTNAKAAANESAGRVVNYAVALRDCFRNAYR